MRPKKTGSLMLKALVYFLLLVSHLALAADVTLQLTGDQTSITLEDQLSLQVSVDGSQQRTPPEIQHAEDFDLRVTGTSSQVQVVNGSMSSQTIFSYVLTPRQAGSFKIGPARVSVGGKTYESNLYPIQVLKTQPTSPDGNAGGNQTANPGRNQFRVEGEVNNRSPYVGQSVIYTFRFYARADLSNARLELPDFKGFVKEPLGKQQVVRKVVDGLPWQVTEIRFLLYPQSAGTATIVPAVLSGEAEVDRPQRSNDPFDRFFSQPFFFRGETKPVHFKSPALSLQIKALPTTGRPPNFSGLVGKFHLTSALSKSQVAVGDSTTLTLVLEGQGNFQDAQLPEIDWKGFKTYDDQPKVESQVANGRLEGSKTFKKALVPLQSGKLTIPSIKIAYFNTESARYELAQTDPLSMDVAPGSGNESLAHVSASTATQETKGIRAQGEDLMPIKRQLSSASEPLNPTLQNFLFLLDFLVPLLSLLGWGLRRRWLARMSDVGFRRKAGATRQFQAKLKQLNAHQGTYYSEASILLREYLGDRFHFDGKALTPADAERKLRTFGLNEATIKTVTDFLRACEQSQYGGSPAGSTSLPSPDDLSRLVKAIDKEASA